MNSLLKLMICITVTIGLWSVSENASAQVICTSAHQMTLSGPDEIKIDPGISVGTVLWTGGVQATPEASGGQCPGGTFTIYMEGARGYLGNNLYDSGVAGISYRLQFGGVTCYRDWWPGSCTGPWNIGMSPHVLVVELVKTGTITGAGSLSGVFAQWTAGAGRNLFAQYSWKKMVTVTPIKPTCAVTTESRAISVSLGNNLPMSTFTGIGSSSPEKPFNITLQCAEGSFGSTTKVHVTLTDQTSPENRSNVLSLSPDSGAAGIGIQVLKGATILSYGPASGESGTTNQWLAGEVSNGTFIIPLTARYVQTATKVKGGKANGRATFTMSYQ